MDMRLEYRDEWRETRPRCKADQLMYSLGIVIVILAKSGMLSHLKSTTENVTRVSLVVKVVLYDILELLANKINLASVVE